MQKTCFDLAVATKNAVSDPKTTGELKEAWTVGFGSFLLQQMNLSLKAVVVHPDGSQFTPADFTFASDRVKQSLKRWADFFDKSETKNGKPKENKVTEYMRIGRATVNKK